MARKDKHNENQGSLFFEDRPDEEVKHVRHEERVRWRVAVFPCRAATKSFKAARDDEGEARSYAEKLQRLVGGNDVIVLFRSWSPPYGKQRALGTKRDDLVWCLWYREDGRWAVDEHH